MKICLYFSGAGEIRRKEPNRMGTNLNQGEDEAFGKQHRGRRRDKKIIYDSLTCKIFIQTIHSYGLFFVGDKRGQRKLTCRLFIVDIKLGNLMIGDQNIRLTSRMFCRCVFE